MCCRFVEILQENANEQVQAISVDFFGRRLDDTRFLARAND